MASSLLCAWLDLWAINIPVPAALAAVCVIGYLFGRQNRQPAGDSDSARRELKRAKAVAKELENIADVLRRDLAAHHASIARFKERVATIGGKQQQEAGWQDLCREAEDVLRPTLRLAAQISHAYDEIRQQSNHLMTFTEVRTDSLTGVSNRRALDETLESMVAMQSRYELPFSLVIFDIDHFKQINDQHGHLHGDQTLKKVAKLIDETVRETDVVFRYGGEEFVVVMPSTTLDGAMIFSDRLRARINEKLDLTVSGGVAAAQTGDVPNTLLARADAALYSSKTAGRNCVMMHDGETISGVTPPAANVSLAKTPVAAR
ncbi:MAG: diguanylate cyclase [Planctomycetia bacterium]|nr:diguanylate cyclase [Planctomycetia bacterium]